METTRVAFLVLAFGALVLAGVLTYNLLSTPEYQPISQEQLPQYVQSPVFNQPAQAGKPKSSDVVHAYAAFNVLPSEG